MYYTVACSRVTACIYTSNIYIFWIVLLMGTVPKTQYFQPLHSSIQTEPELVPLTEYVQTLAGRYVHLLIDTLGQWMIVNPT